MICLVIMILAPTYCLSIHRYYTTFFPAIGKAAKGAALSFAKQILFLVPLLLLLPRRFGLDGVMFAQPISDFLSFILAVILLTDEMRKMPKEDLT